MEFAHRSWGRAIGAFFLLPATYFWARGAFNTPMKVRVVLFGALIAAQVSMNHSFFHMYLYIVLAGFNGLVHG